MATAIPVFITNVRLKCTTNWDFIWLQFNIFFVFYSFELLLYYSTYVVRCSSVLIIVKKNCACQLIREYLLRTTSPVSGPVNQQTSKHITVVCRLDVRWKRRIFWCECEFCRRHIQHNEVKCIVTSALAPEFVVATHLTLIRWCIHTQTVCMCQL